VDGADREIGGRRRRKRLLGERRGRRGGGSRRRRLVRAPDDERGTGQSAPEPPQVATSAAAPVSTASPRSVFAVSTIFPGEICHMSVVIVSPGNTTPEKRTSNDSRRSGSELHHAARSARPAKPKVQRPCRIGRS